MAKLRPRSPTRQDEKHYQQWAEEYLFNDRKCDYCERLLPEENLQIHDVYDHEAGRDLEKKVFCSTYCYAAGRQPELIDNEKLTAEVIRR